MVWSFDRVGRKGKVWETPSAWRLMDADAVQGKLKEEVSNFPERVTISVGMMCKK